MGQYKDALFPSVPCLIAMVTLGIWELGGPIAEQALGRAKYKSCPYMSGKPCPNNFPNQRSEDGTPPRALENV
jgi:hypothetical protein